MKFTCLKEYIRVLAIITVIDLLILTIYDYAVYGFEVKKSPIYWLPINLALGLVPLVIALVLHYFSDKLNKFFLVAGSLLWLLFYPNAPYMITDFVHMGQISGVTNLDKAEIALIYGDIIIFLYAMLSLFYGFFSLLIMRRLFTKLTSQRTAAIIIVVCIVLSSFGLYMGRFLMSGPDRINSWDLFTHPMQLLGVVVEQFKHLMTYVAMFLFSFLQFSILRLMKDLEEPATAT